MKHINDISDTEVRRIGHHKSPIRQWYWALALIPAIIIIVWLLWSSSTDSSADQTSQQPHPLKEWINSLDTIPQQIVMTTDYTVNDIPLRIYAPLNCAPRLEIGYEVTKNFQNNLLLFQAADIRADNEKIVGAFVLRGEPLSWGLSKKGFCAIIDEEVTVGVAENSPLFEEATDRGGYFFRQYPLVDQGTLVENTLKNKYVRRGLCELEGRIVVIETLSQETMHDFTQALIDIGVCNAIYLVGANAMGWVQYPDGTTDQIGIWEHQVHQNISFIVWSK